MTKVYLLLKIILNWFQKETINSEDHAQTRYKVADDIMQEVKGDNNHQLFNPH